MFERYTEKARRVVFFARYEASQYGSSHIETEHLLLAILREDNELVTGVMPPQLSLDLFRKKISSHSPPPYRVSSSADLPLSNESNRVLAYSAEEAERFSNRYIGAEHLLLGLLRESGSFTAQLLQQEGLSLEKVREAIEGRLAG